MSYPPPVAAYLVLLLGLVLGIPAAGQGQLSSTRPAAPASTKVKWTAGPIELNGKLDEPAWHGADSVSDFRQRDPVEGRPATERTVVRFLGTSEGLFVGFWGYDRLPGDIRHAQLRRDADFDSDDSFSLLLDPQRDRRSGYVFSVNPNGALFDAELLGPDQDNPDWDGVWDARAQRTAEGWTAEVFLPWQTLRYPDGMDAWGLNLRRFIRRTNEEVLWRGWRRQQGFLFQEAEGILQGLDSLPGRRGPELRPYVATTGTLRERDYQADGHSAVVAEGEGSVKIGGDAKLGFGPALTLDLTANTDFAQVEADRAVVNLTRFPLFFPEKRPFFLEGGGTFEFGRLEHTQLFYSRRVGLADDGTALPIVAGARLHGRTGRDRLGFLAARTGGEEDAIDLVARIKHDVLSRSYVGALLTAQTRPGSALRLGAGTDIELPMVVHGQNLTLSGFGAATGGGSDGPTSTSTATAWGLLADYPNDWSDNSVSVTRIGGGFDPALGFVREDGIWRFTGEFRVFPRPRRLGIRRLGFKLIDWDVTTDLDGELAHAAYEIRPVGLEFESGDEAEINLQRFHDVPREDFEVFPGSTITAGRYRYDRVEAQVTTSPGRPLSLEFTASAGDFYDGSATIVEAGVVLRATPHLIAEIEYGAQAVRRRGGDFTAQMAGLRLDFAVNPRFGTTLFTQWENESNRLTMNARLHWTPRPGSDVYLVWNGAWPTGLNRGIPWSRPLHGALTGKFVHYLRM